MKKNMIKLAAGAAAVLLMSTSAHAGYTMKKKVGDVDTKLTFFGFSQLEARTGDGQIADNQDSKIAFGAQRIRLGWKYEAGKVRGKVFLDFNQKHEDIKKTGDGAVMPSMVKDAFVSYVADPAFVVKLGLIKMPNGMSFTMPGWNLDIAERGFDKKLVMERNTGLMVSGRAIGGSGKVDGLEMGHERPWVGFGYDVMMANQASRSAVAKSSKNGGNSYAVRGMYDNTETLHLEASYAITENAKGLSGVAGGEDYSNINLGIDSNLGELSLKAEYFDAKNIKGTKDWNEKVITATVGYFVTPSLELVTKYMKGDAEGNAAADMSLSNTYLGFNYFLSSPKTDFSRKSKRNRNQHKVVFNYVVANGDTDTWNQADLGGYLDDTFIAQYQFKF